jgi:hypothetical protein
MSYIISLILSFQRHFTLTFHKIILIGIKSVSIDGIRISSWSAEWIHYIQKVIFFQSMSTLTWSIKKYFLIDLSNPNMIHPCTRNVYVIYCMSILIESIESFSFLMYEYISFDEYIYFPEVVLISIMSMISFKSK